jgi:translation initiation factor 1
MERSGRGGKEATVIEQLQLTARERESWLKALKSSLGCGGSIEGDSIMLQGDQRERLKRVLADRGVKKVIVG